MTTELVTLLNDNDLPFIIDQTTVDAQEIADTITPKLVAAGVAQIVVVTETHESVTRIGEVFGAHYGVPPVDGMDIYNALCAALLADVTGN